jgi:putative ABC transport system substrate-binding protein
MRRRTFIALLGGAAVAWPLAARAQQRPKIPRIGIIDEAPMWNAFRQGLRDLGYVEGQNIAFDYRYADGVPERLAQAAAELVRLPVDVIVTYGTPATVAARRECYWEYDSWPRCIRQAAPALQRGGSRDFARRLALEPG